MFEEKAKISTTPTTVSREDKSIKDLLQEATQRHDELIRALVRKIREREKELAAERAQSVHACSEISHLRTQLRDTQLSLDSKTSEYDQLVTLVHSLQIQLESLS